MRKIESKNYIFNYNEGSVAEKQLEKIINIQETCFEFICNTLEVNMPCKINYYLCDSPEQVGEIFGDNEPILLGKTRYLLGIVVGKSSGMPA